MKFVILLCVFSVLLLQRAGASPVKLVEHQERGLSRQQTSDVAPVVVQATEEDDDDEDDDDDEPDLGDLIDDDDDDEEDDDDEGDDDDEDDRPQGQAAPSPGSDDDDEDDDDDDYLDRLFDDILGDEDDDEDDDDEEPSVSVQNIVAASPAAPIEDIVPVGQAAGAGVSDGVDLPAESDNVNESLASANDADNEIIPSSSSNNEGEQNVFYDEDEVANNSIVDGINSSISSGSDNKLINSSGSSGSVGSISNTNENHTHEQEQQQEQEQTKTSSQSDTLKHTPNVIKTSSSSTNKNHNLNQLPSLPPSLTTVLTAGKPVDNTAANNVKDKDEDEEDDDEDDDDDDDDEDIDVGVDDITGALTSEDDDDADDDEDDDDDDIIGDDVIEARREARSLKNNIIDISSDAFQERNNQFVDAIFARINRIVSDNYDPFVVQLNGRSTIKHHTKSAATTDTAIKNQQKSKIKAAKPQATNTSIKKLKNTKSEPRTNTDNDNEHITSSNTIISISNSNVEEFMPKDTKNEPKYLNKLQQQLEQLEGQQKKLKATEQIGKNVVTSEQEQQQKTEIYTDDMKQETRNAIVKEVVKSGNQEKSITKVQKHHSATKKVHNNSNATKNNKSKLKYAGTVNNKNGAGNGKDVTGNLKTEGSLSGLASLKRVGNVKLATDPEGRNSTIKAKFTLGPLILRVEKSFKRGGVENVKSATARTNKMIGRIKFSVVNDHATLMSIKVQQPKQVEVESKDNHDRTREFVWRRTPKIARLVNEKLKLAAETLFAPQGVEVVRL